MTAYSEIPKVGYEAFRTEYAPKVNTEALKKDLQSYLGEYRFQVQKYDYELSYSLSADGKKHLKDVDDKEAMVVKAERAIDRRVNENKDSTREIAEKKGLESLDRQLHNAQFGDQIIWISPPGLKSEGYGSYAFVFIGTIDQIDQYTQDKHISMTALRVEQPQIANFNLIMSFVTGDQIQFIRPEQFLATPKVVPYFNQDIKDVVVDMLNLQPSENDKLYQKIMPALSHSINEFTEYVKEGKSKDFLFKALQSIEMYALDLIEQYKSAPQSQLLHSQNQIPLGFIMNHYKDKKPTPVAGSCGNANSSSSESSSSNIFNKYSTLSEIFSNNEDYKNDPNLCRCGGKEPHFHCPGKTEDGNSCNHAIVVGEGTTKCPNPKCGLDATCA